MEVRFFGEFEALEMGVPMPVRGVKQRTVLALLALQRGKPVSADRLIDVLWGDEQIANAANALQAQVGQLRRILGATAIVTSEAGYALGIGPDDLTLVATEARAQADLVLGHHGELVGELEALCREHPLRERLWELLMLALYRAGRQAEALRAYTEARDRLVDQLGIDPGPALRELEARILAQDPTLAPAGPAGLAAVPAPMATGNLREPLSSFVGRAGELEELTEAV